MTHPGKRAARLKWGRLSSPPRPGRGLTSKPHPLRASPAFHARGPASLSIRAGQLNPQPRCSFDPFASHRISRLVVSSPARRRVSSSHPSDPRRHPTPDQRRPQSSAGFLSRPSTRFSDPPGRRPTRTDPYLRPGAEPKARGRDRPPISTPFREIFPARGKMPSSPWVKKPGSPPLRPGEQNLRPSPRHPAREERVAAGPRLPH